MCAHIHTNTLICSGRHQRTTTNTIPTTETTTTITIPTIQTTTTATITATSARAPARVADHTTGITSHSLTSLACLLPSAQRPREVEEVPVVLGGGGRRAPFPFLKAPIFPLMGEINQIISGSRDESTEEAFLVVPL